MPGKKFMASTDASVACQESASYGFSSATGLVTLRFVVQVRVQVQGELNTDWLLNGHQGNRDRHLKINYAWPCSRMCAGHAGSRTGVIKELQ